MHLAQTIQQKSTIKNFTIQIKENDKIESYPT